MTALALISLANVLVLIWLMLYPAARKSERR